MDFRRKTRPRTQHKVEIDSLEQLFPHNVMMYRLPPVQDITIQEFEDLALERLKVLRIFEQAGNKPFRFLSDEYKASVLTELNKEGLRGYVRLLNGTANSAKESDLQARRRDYQSHFILRLAYCRSQDLRRWFLMREMELFKFKFLVLSPSEIKQFLALNNLSYNPLSEEEKDSVRSGLYESTAGYGNQNIEQLDFYKVKFTQVLDLVRHRRCYLQDGFAYVNAHDFVSIIAGLQQSEIERGLAGCQTLLPEVENDDRLFHLLKGLHTSYTGKDYTINKGNSITPECLDQLSKKSFPLCMRFCHEALRAKHHLKHGGRMQYGLFLKGIGVSLEDSLRFWREEFTRMMDLEKFEKSYSYNIRHNYGKEGSMVNYTPYSCIKIITTHTPPGDTHGCPFKLLDQSALKMRLASYGISAAHAQDVATYASSGHWQLACAKYFEIVHDSKLEQGINHPNQFFELSQDLMENREPKTSAGTPTRKKLAKKTLNLNNESSHFEASDDHDLWNCVTEKEADHFSTATRTNLVSNIGKNNDKLDNEIEWEEPDFDVTKIDEHVLDMMEK